MSGAAVGGADSNSETIVSSLLLRWLQVQQRDITPVCHLVKLHHLSTT